MRKENKLYIVLSYVLFILPPFIWALVEIYSEGNSKNPHITSLIINILLYFIGVLIIFLLIKKEKLRLPNKEDIKHLIFGFIGNTTVYFYTFQNNMNIENIVTIYLVLIIILFFYYYLFSKQFKPLELWLIIPIFLVIDILHMLITGCGFNDGYTCFEGVDNVFTYLLYIVLVITILFIYIYKTIKLNPNSIFKYINIALVIMVSFMVQNIEAYDSRFFGTLMIALPFFVILEFIITIVNKTYSHKTLLFYFRTTTIFFVMSFLNEMDFFHGNANYEILILMIAITYTSLAISILSHLLKVEDHTSRKAFKIKFISNNDYTEEFKYNPEEQFLFIKETPDGIIEHIIVDKNELDTIKEATITLTDEIDIESYILKIEQISKSKNINQIKIISSKKEEDLSKRNYGLLLINNIYYYIKKI